MRMQGTRKDRAVMTRRYTSLLAEYACGFLKYEIQIEPNEIINKSYYQTFKSHSKNNICFVSRMSGVQIAKGLWIETAKKHGKPIPKPKSQKVIEPKKRFNVMFPESLLQNVGEYRGKHGLKRSELLAAAAEQYISTTH